MVNMGGLLNFEDKRMVELALRDRVKEKDSANAVKARVKTKGLIAP